MKTQPPRTTKQDDSYIPHSDSGKRIWMAQFVKTIERSGNHFGIGEKDFAGCQRAVQEFIDAYDVQPHPSQRTVPGTQRKNTARKAALQHCRSLAMRLKFDPSISNGHKCNLGLHLDDAILTPLNPPEQCPHLLVRGTANGGHAIRFHQRAASNRNTAKPKGVTHLLLFAAIGDRALPVSEARLVAGITKQPHTVEFPAGLGCEGATITYYGRWITRRGEMGPWSPGVSMILSRANARYGEMEFDHLFDQLFDQRCSERAAA